MPAALTLQDMASLARLAWLESGDEPELSRAAVTWALLNRKRAVADTAASAKGVGAVASSPAGPLLSSLSFEDPAFCRAFATVCLVCGGDLEDPTRGATRYHAHDELPGWARSREPLALIGRRFFY